MSTLKLITTHKDYLLLVDTKAPIDKDMVALYQFRNQSLVGRITHLPTEEGLDEMVEFEGENVDVSGVDQVIAHLPLNDAPVLEGVLLMPNLTKQEDDDVALQTIAEDEAIKASDGYCEKDNHCHDCPCSAFEEGYIKGYKAASQKRWSNEDVVKFTKWFFTERSKRLARLQTADDSKTLKETYMMIKNRPMIEWVQEYSQSLSPKPIGFEPELLQPHEKFKEFAPYGLNIRNKDVAEQLWNKYYAGKDVFKTVKTEAGEVLQGRYLYET